MGVIFSRVTRVWNGICITLAIDSTFHEHERTEHIRDNLREGITGVVHLQLAQQAVQFIC